MFMKSFENTSIQDKIYAKYNIRTLELMHSVRHYGLDKDSDVVALRIRSSIAARTLSPDVAEVV